MSRRNPRQTRRVSDVTPFSPSQLPGLRLWLRSDLKVTTGATFTWGDLGPVGQNFTQSTGANQPTVTASDANFNNKPSLTFDGTDDVLTNASFSMGGAPTAQFIWCVVRLLAAGSFPCIWSGASAIEELRGNSTSGDPSMLGDGGTVAATWGSSIVGSTKAVAGYDNTTIVSINVSNGVAVTAASGSSITNTPVSAGIGARPAGSLFANMAIAELILCNLVPSVGQLAALQAYAKGRYGNV